MDRKSLVTTNRSVLSQDKLIFTVRPILEGIRFLCNWKVKNNRLPMDNGTKQPQHSTLGEIFTHCNKQGSQRMRHVQSKRTSRIHSHDFANEILKNINSSRLLILLADENYSML